MGRTRKFATTLLVLLVPAGAGVVTVQASPTCERYVRTYVTVPVRNKVSKATAVAWAKWRVGHPNWKPNPAVHRPRYKMTRKEQLEKVAFACEVPTQPKLVDVLFTPDDLNPPNPDITMTGTDTNTPVTPPLETADVTVPGDIPPVTTTRTPPYADVVFPPSGTPYFPPVFGAFPPPPAVTGQPGTTPQGGSTTVAVLPPGAAVPEPSSYLLLATGAGFLLLIIWPGAVRAAEPVRAVSRSRSVSRS